MRLGWSQLPEWSTLNRLPVLSPPAKLSLLELSMLLELDSRELGQLELRRLPELDLREPTAPARPKPEQCGWSRSRGCCGRSFK